MPGRLDYRRLLLLGALLAALPALTGASAPATDFRLLAAHNAERAALGVPALRWDPALATDAAAYAKQLAATERFEHSEVAPGDTDPQGENLWMGTRGYYSPEAMVGLWIDEKADFKPGVFPDNSRSNDLAAVGHYTQVAWRATRTVGCAIARSPADEYLVCRYATAGNVLGERPF